jgi:hypothetical protein
MGRLRRVKISFAADTKTNDLDGVCNTASPHDEEVCMDVIIKGFRFLVTSLVFLAGLYF